MPLICWLEVFGIYHHIPELDLLPLWPCCAHHFIAFLYSLFSTVPSGWWCISHSFISSLKLRWTFCVSFYLGSILLDVEKKSRSEWALHIVQLPVRMILLPLCDFNTMLGIQERNEDWGFQVVKGWGDSSDFIAGAVLVDIPYRQCFSLSSNFRLNSSCFRLDRFLVFVDQEAHIHRLAAVFFFTTFYS